MLFVFLQHRIEEVFEWIFEVEESPRNNLDEDAGRVAFTVTYERRQSDVHSNEDVDKVINRKVVGKVQIQDDNIYAIVPVIKVSISPLNKCLNDRKTNP